MVELDRARNQQAQPALFPAARDLRQSAMSGLSRLWRPTAGPGGSAPSSQPAGKTFVVPLFLSTSRSSARNNFFTSGGLPANPRPGVSTRPTVEDTVAEPQGVYPLPSRRDQDETSDLYAGSVREQRLVDEVLAPVPMAHNLDDTPTPSERSTRQHSQGSGSHSTQSTHSMHSSRRSGRTHGTTASRKPSRDAEVHAKARMTFAFGVTLLVALVICEWQRFHR